MLVVVEGPMGAGKTTLTRLLSAHFQATAYYEDPGRNPFLADLYSAQRHALATELHFLLQRRAQWQQLSADLCFSDHGPDKDLLFIQQTLHPLEQELYLQLRQDLLPHLPPIDLLICLDAPLPVLRDRICRRGDRWDAAMDLDYLAQIQKRYELWFAGYQGPCLDLRHRNLDFVGQEKDGIILTELVGKTLRAMGQTI